jgi:hypothetical protein
VDTVFAVWEELGPEERKSQRERWISKNEQREARGAFFVHVVLRRSFADAADWRQLNRRLREIWPPRSRAGRNHSAALIEEGWLVLSYESRGLRGVRLLDRLKVDGLKPPGDSHSKVLPVDANWLRKRRKAVLWFAAAIEERHGTPPAWLIPPR